ncbi:hypothetical protein KSS87_008133 [Heliosperma pusillum]|nr:hypothetical protein KSS87_008133 [Heliosperma pusillum]
MGDDEQVEVEKHPALQNQQDEDEDDMKKLILPDISTLPLSPPTSVQTNFVRYYILVCVNCTRFRLNWVCFVCWDGNNRLCVIGLAPSHVALQPPGGVTSVDFNVGKSDRSEFKVTGKRKRNAQHFQPNSILCNVSSGDTSYVVRCCVKGSLLEVNNRLMNNSGLLNTSADRDGYIAIVMPKPADWLKSKESLVSFEEYTKLRKLS